MKIANIAHNKPSEIDADQLKPIIETRRDVPAVKYRGIIDTCALIVTLRISSSLAGLTGTRSRTMQVTVTILDR